MLAKPEQVVIDIPGFINDGVHKRLTFTTEGLTIEKPKSFQQPVFIPADHIAAFRYEGRWLRGYKLAFGLQYLIEIQDFSGKITSLKLNSFYGIRKNTYYKAWSEILHQLWHFYFLNMLNYYKELKNIGQTFELAGVSFHPHGISWDNNVSMFYHEVALANYQTYFMIYRADFKKHRKSCSFAQDWNAVVLQLLLKEIIEEEEALKSH